MRLKKLNFQVLRKKMGNKRKRKKVIGIFTINKKDNIVNSVGSKFKPYIWS